MTDHKTIGIFGGSFNPVHDGHIAVADTVLKKGVVDEVWFMPCKKHPFSKDLADAKDRIAMLKKATRHEKNIKISLLEQHLKGINYTYKTVNALKKRYPHSFVWIVGSDLLSTMHTWHGKDTLFKAIRFIIYKRDRHGIKIPKGMSVIDIVTNNTSSLSSTEIRQRIKDGKSLRRYLHPSVMAYIRKKRLYQ